MQAGRTVCVPQRGGVVSAPTGESTVFKKMVPAEPFKLPDFDNEPVSPPVAATRVEAAVAASVGAPRGGTMTLAEKLRAKRARIG